MDIERIIAKLSPLERRVLPYLSSRNLTEIVKKSGLKQIQVMRALQWLSNKGILKIIEKEKEIIFLGENGREYRKKGLPERRFLNALSDKFLDVKKLLDKANLKKQELNICIGSLKKKAAIELKKDNGLLARITDNGKNILKNKSLEEKFLENQFPLNTDKLKPEQNFALDNLLKRKDILRKEKIKIRNIELTQKGKELSKIKIKEGEFIDKLTPEMLKSGKWRGKKFRQYDVEINVPSIYRGKRHFLKQARRSAKRIWLDMGFKEMKGNMVQSSFWNFDALFTAQDHPVREMHDTFFIAKPENAKLPDKRIIEEVRKVHENGGDTGSKGWQYKWSKEKARKNVLRTHTTSLSARTLAELDKKDIPAKFFNVSRCFRNESLDWCHLFEFNQTDGIVIDPDANFRHLLGYLKEFFKKMGYKKARFRPAYFPYTEPSVEIDVFHPVHKEWVELGGAGIFRPEVVKPLLGIDVPVLAWGPGFDRIILEFFKINDIRELYKNDLDQLRKIKEWTR